MRTSVGSISWREIREYTVDVDLTEDVAPQVVANAVPSFDSVSCLSRMPVRI